MLQQPLQQKQITNGKRLILAGRRHVASRARESRKDFAWGALAVPIKGGVERGRSTLGDRLRDPSRMLIRRRGFWLGSAHRAWLCEVLGSSNQATVAGIWVAAMSKSANPHLNPHAAFGSLMRHTGSRQKQPRTYCRMARSERFELINQHIQYTSIFLRSLARGVFRGVASASKDVRRNACPSRAS